jgi:hypothetical protein
MSARTRTAATGGPEPAGVSRTRLDRIHRTGSVVIGLACGSSPSSASSSGWTSSPPWGRRCSAPRVPDAERDLRSDRRRSPALRGRLRPVHRTAASGHPYNVERGRSLEDAEGGEFARIGGNDLDNSTSDQVAAAEPAAAERAVAEHRADPELVAAVRRLDAIRRPEDRIHAWTERDR